MAQAVFHKSQRVYVKPVGTYALIERVIPHWVKGVEEPLRIVYDCGLGREFKATELVSEDSRRGQSADRSADQSLLEQWRLERKQNRHIVPEETMHHPYPGTFPVIQTDDIDWGGWRVPGAEYNRDPARIEYQARMIANSPDMLRVCKAVVSLSEAANTAQIDELQEIAKTARTVLRHIYDKFDLTTAPAVAAE